MVARMLALLATGAVSARQLLADFATLIFAALFTMLFALVTALYSCYPIGFYLIGTLPISIMSVKTFYITGLRRKIIVVLF
jgi:hypothetical protein